MIMIAIVVWSIDVEFGNCGLLPIPLDNLVSKGRGVECWAIELNLAWLFQGAGAI